MILGGLGRRNVTDDKLWELVEQANHLTQGGYDDWDANAQALVPVMERIMMIAREREEWQVYFYDMAKLFWFVRRTKVNNIRLAFQIAEMFHQNYQSHIGEIVNAFSREWLVNIAGDILGFYSNYPQIDDRKMEEMLGIYRDCEEKYGSDWNYGDYTSIMWLALMNHDKELAKEAARKLKRAQFSNWCYICTYGRPMIGYYILQEDFETAKEWVFSLIERSMPQKYHWCFEKCQQAGETDLVDLALAYSMQLGKSQAFDMFFAEWGKLYEKEKGEVEDTHNVIFHALAGEWSQQEEVLQLAQKDNRGRREQKETPLDCLYWSLCWYCYFQLLAGSGVETVYLELDEDGKRQWSCMEAAEYFERQADLLGEQMDKARKKFGYSKVKRCYEECLLKDVGD